MGSRARAVAPQRGNADGSGRQPLEAALHHRQHGLFGLLRIPRRLSGVPGGRQAAPRRRKGAGARRCQPVAGRRLFRQGRPADQPGPRAICAGALGAEPRRRARPGHGGLARRADERRGGNRAAPAGDQPCHGGGPRRPDGRAAVGRGDHPGPAPARAGQPRAPAVVRRAPRRPARAGPGHPRHPAPHRGEQRSGVPLQPRAPVALRGPFQRSRQPARQPAAPRRPAERQREVDFAAPLRRPQRRCRHRGEARCWCRRSLRRDLVHA